MEKVITKWSDHYIIITTTSGNCALLFPENMNFILPVSIKPVVLCTSPSIHRPFSLVHIAPSILCFETYVLEHLLGEALRILLISILALNSQGFPLFGRVTNRCCKVSVALDFPNKPDLLHTSFLYFYLFWTDYGIPQNQ